MAKIAIFAPSRFHVLSLGEALQRRGHDVTFYSYAPRWKLTAYAGEVRIVSIFWFVAPLIAIRQAGLGRLSALAGELTNWLADHILTRLVPASDFAVLVSGCFNRCERRARRLGSRVVVERGSKHISEQFGILAREPDVRPDILRAWARTIRREQRSYEAADLICVPASHCVRSFERHQPDLLPKLRVVPYGVSLQEFPPTPRPANQVPVVLMVGTWSYQKGADRVTRLFEGGDASGLHFVHVGAVSGASFPTTSTMSHADSVPQRELGRFYARADVFVLLSRQEGMAMVQLQALASGLPVVCTVDTGGEDLRDQLVDPGAIVVVNGDDPADVRRGIDAALASAAKVPPGTDRVVLRDPQALSWTGYARAYEERVLSDRSGRRVSGAGG